MHPQPHYIEPALLQIADIATQFLVVHLGILFYFLLEIGRRFADFGESGDVEGAVAGDGGAVQRPLPALFEDPSVHALGPVSALGMDALGDVEADGVDLEDGEVGKLIAVGVEKLVIVDVIVLAENPAAVRA